MISVIVPTLNAAHQLGPTLAALVPASVEGLISEVIIADGGSVDGTDRIADAWGAKFIQAERGRGSQLGAGAAEAQKPWLLFLHADTRLEPGWEHAARRLMEEDEGRAGAFRFRLADRGVSPRLVEAGVALRCALLSLPYGDQGLLISRKLYDEIGGFRPIPIMEDVDLVRRLGRRRLAILDAAAVTSAERFRTQGYFGRILRNLGCLALFYGGVSPSRIARLYG